MTPWRLRFSTVPAARWRFCVQLRASQRFLERHTERRKERQRETEREREKKIQTGRKRDTDRQADKKIQTDNERQSQRQTDRHNVVTFGEKGGNKTKLAKKWTQ